jgi:hypothetical protein
MAIWIKSSNSKTNFFLILKIYFMYKFVILDIKKINWFFLYIFLNLGQGHHEFNKLVNKSMIQVKYKKYFFNVFSIFKKY